MRVPIFIVACLLAPGVAAGRDVATVGNANAAKSASAGWIQTSSPTVTPSRRIQPHVVKSDKYMWSSTNT